MKYKILHALLLVIFTILKSPGPGKYTCHFGYIEFNLTY